MINEAKFSFGKITFEGDFVIAEINNGIVFDVCDSKKLFEYCDKFYEGRSYNYISNRINSYSVNPVIYLSLDKYNVTAMAIVTTLALTKQNSFLEKHFAQLPLEVFENILEAKIWLESQKK
ncbi:MAG: hypothetical protein V7767_14065 [Leeuwenhoekiella sp.]